MIYVPVIRVYDKDLKREHIVGTNIHDTLVTNGKSISYYNMQNGCGTGETYEFVGEKTPFGGKAEIEMMPLNKFLELYTKLAKEQNDIEEHFQEDLAEIRKQFDREEEIKSKDGYTRHT